MPGKTKGIVGNFRVKQIPERKCRGHQVELQSRNLKIILEGSAEMDPESNVSKPYSEITAEFSYTKKSHEGFRHSSSGKESVFFKKIAGNKYVYDENSGAFNNNTDLLDKIRLPDEDSLITADDFIVPVDDDSVPISSDDRLDFSIAVDIAEELLASDETTPGEDDRSCQLSMMRSFNIYGSRRNSETDHQSIYAQQFDHWIHQSQMISEIALYHLDYPQQAQVSSKLVPVDIGICSYNRLRHGTFVQNSELQSFQQWKEVSGLGCHCSNPHELRPRRSHGPVNGVPRDALFQSRISQTTCSAMRCFGS